MKCIDIITALIDYLTKHNFNREYILNLIYRSIIILGLLKLFIYFIIFILRYSFQTRLLPLMNDFSFENSLFLSKFQNYP